VRKPIGKLVLLSAIIALGGASTLLAATPAEIAASRQASLTIILTTAPVDAVKAQRLTCMFGEEPDRVIRNRCERATYATRR
jgi:hypothetical protein